MEISADFASGDRPSVFGEYPIGLRKKRRQSTAGVSPLVDYLLEYTRI